MAARNSTRRNFLQASAGVLALGVGGAGSEGFESRMDLRSTAAAQQAPKASADDGKKPLRLGVIVGIGSDPESAIGKVHSLGLPTCQIYADNFSFDLVQIGRAHV